MNCETTILVGLSALLVAIWTVAVVRDWMRRRRLTREIAAGLAQRWVAPRAGWTAEDERRWRKLGESGLLGE